MRFLASSPPTGEHIRELHEHNLTTWEPQRTLDERLKKLVYGENLVTLPDTNARGRNRRVEAERMHTGEAARIVSLIKPLYNLSIKTIAYAHNHVSLLNSLLNFLPNLLLNHNPNHGIA